MKHKSRDGKEQQADADAVDTASRTGGGEGIRTPERSPPARFPSVCIKPLCHPSVRFKLI